MLKIKALLVGLILFVSGSAYGAQTINTDVLIIGAGAGGMSAGVSAIEQGLNAVILEKMPAIGGSGNYMEGTFAVGSYMQLRDNVGIDAEKQFKIVMDFHHWRINADVLNDWLKRTASTIEWCEKHGVKFERVMTAFVDGNRTWHMFEGGHGSSLIQAFNKEFTAKGGKIYTETPVKSLTVKNGRVTGAVAEDIDGEQIIINAKAVIVATGGFPCNQEMIAKYLPYDGYLYAGAAGRDGDGIRMMEEVGAKLVNMNVVMQAGLWLKGVDTNLQFGVDGRSGARYVRLLAALNQPFLKVSPRGARVVDETQSLEYTSNAFEGVGGEGYAVFDENTKREMVEQGMINGYFGMVERGQRFDNFDALFAEGEKQGFCYKANTLDELARKTGMDAGTLKATVARMNKMYNDKYDDQFYKDPKWLRPVEKGPFYAINGSLRMYSTTGGAAVNSDFQVTDNNGNVIAGLYAVGQDAGGLYSDSYDMHIAEGTASSWAINGGRFASAHIAKSIK